MNGKKTALSLAIGSAFAVSLAASPIANAAENPFGMSALKSGYMLADASDMKASDKKMPEGKCGDMSAKSNDGMKAADKKMPEGKPGGKKVTKAQDGKCGGKMDDKAAAPAPADKK